MKKNITPRIYKWVLSAPLGRSFITGAMTIEGAISHYYGNRKYSIGKKYFQEEKQFICITVYSEDEYPWTERIEVEKYYNRG